MNINNKNEEYKKFESEWASIAKKIKDLRNKYVKYYTNNKIKEIKENSKEYKIFIEKEQEIKDYLNTQCYSFLNSKIPIIREIEKRKAKEIKEICYKFKKLLKIENEKNYELSKMESENAASIDIYQELKDIFIKENNIFQIREFDNFMDNLKDKILAKIDFSEDNLAIKVKGFLDNYSQNEVEMSIEPSFSDSAIYSLREGQLKEDENNINKFENKNNINKKYK